MSLGEGSSFLALLAQPQGRRNRAQPRATGNGAEGRSPVHSTDPWRLYERWAGWHSLPREATAGFFKFNLI